MTVYVDKAKYHFGRMIMCHMIADTPAELHHMANIIDVRREWFQRFASSPHYDISKSKRALAIANGAIEISRHCLASILPKLRQTWPIVKGDGWQ